MRSPASLLADRALVLAVSTLLVWMLGVGCVEAVNWLRGVL